MTYLDNAATSYPKPPQVVREVQRCLKSCGGNPGRGSHKMAVKAAEKIYETRELVSFFVGCGNPENVIFTLNDTYALNMAIKGVLRPGDHVIISNIEHNSVYRPIRQMSDYGLISFSVFDAFASDITSQIEKLIRPQTRAVIANHVSNICSLALPAKEIGTLCRARKILFILDAAQSAGHTGLDMERMNIDILCAPGHKGLMGIQGCGFLALRDGMPFLETMIEGGSGVNSLEPQMPDQNPEHLEAGTLPTPAIAALGEGIKFVRLVGTDEISRRTAHLCDFARDALCSLPRVKVFAPKYQGSTVLFSVTGESSDKISSLLDSQGICTRSGFHCCPLGHKALGTPQDGAVRISFGYFNEPSDVDRLWRAMKEIL